MTDIQSAQETRLIAYARDLAWEDLPPAAASQAKRRIADTIGGALGAYGAEPCRIARRIAPATAQGPRIWGSLARTTPEAAAFANGTALRYLDINDTHRTIDGSHPSDNLGGLVAMVEALGGTGRDLILATAISYEVQARFVDAVPFNDNGWDQPVPGVMAMALAAGRLLGLDAAAMRDALALAIIPNLCTYQTRAGELSMWKGCAAANGARNGIFAARLAAEGMTGPYAAFDGIYGLWNQTLGSPYDLPDLSRGDGLFAVQQTNIKMYPVRDSCQLPVDTAKDLRALVPAARIARLRISTYSSAYKGAVADPELWAPRTRETADHSMLFSVAGTLLDGTVTPESFERARFRDADVLDLIGRTEVDVCAEFSARAPAVRTCRLEAWEADGTHHVAERRLTAADIERGPSDEELEGKFMALATRAIPEGAAARLWAALMKLEEADMADIVEATRV